MRHDPFIYVALLVHACDLPHLHVRHDSCTLWHDSCTCVTWLVHTCNMCDMTYTHVRRDSIPGMSAEEAIKGPAVGTRALIACDMAHLRVWHGACRCVPWLLRICDVTQSQVWALKKLSKDLMLAHLHLNVWHAWSNCVTGLMHMRAITHAYMSPDSIPGMSAEEAIKGPAVGTRALIRVTWLIYACDMARVDACHDSCVYMTWLNPRYECWRSYRKTCCWHTSAHTCDVTHPRAWHGTCRCVPWLMHTCDVTQSQVCALKKLSKDLLLAHEHSARWSAISRGVLHIGLFFMSFSYTSISLLSVSFRIYQSFFHRPLFTNIGLFNRVLLIYVGLFSLHRAEHLKRRTYQSLFIGLFSQI